MNPSGQLSAPIQVRAGDSLAAICGRIYGLPAAQTKKHWGEFYRKARVSGALVPVKDPNKIYAGETLYHRPAGVKNGESGSEAGAVSDGVTNPSPTTPSPSELKILRKDMERAKDLITKARDALKQGATGGSVRKLFTQEFADTGAIGMPDVDKNAKTVATNYHSMLQAIGRARLQVQQEMPVTVTGSSAWAFASKSGITVWRRGYFVDLKHKPEVRAQILIHELAHFAFDAGHDVDQDGKGGFVFGDALNDAERYATFAGKMK